MNQHPSTKKPALQHLWVPERNQFWLFPPPVPVNETILWFLKDTTGREQARVVPAAVTVIFEATPPIQYDYLIIPPETADEVERSLSEILPWARYPFAISEAPAPGTGEDRTETNLRRAIRWRSAALE